MNRIATRFCSYTAAGECLRDYVSKLLELSDDRVVLGAAVDAAVAGFVHMSRVRGRSGLTVVSVKELANAVELYTRYEFMRRKDHAAEQRVNKLVRRWQRIHTIA